MKCKTDSDGAGEMTCLKEGRKVTRCAAGVYVFDEALIRSIVQPQLTDIPNRRIKDINTHCLDVFRLHWGCLESNNHQLWQCRVPEMMLNKCVFDNLKLEKVIPGTPEGVVPVHLREKQIFSNRLFGNYKNLAKSPFALRQEQPVEAAKTPAPQ